MNMSDLRDRLQQYGAVLRWIVYVPREDDRPTAQREGRLNLIMVDDGYVVCSYERRERISEHFFAERDDALRDIAHRSV